MSAALASSEASPHLPPVAWVLPPCVPLHVLLQGHHPNDPIGPRLPLSKPTHMGKAWGLGPSVKLERTQFSPHLTTTMRHLRVAQLIPHGRMMRTGRWICGFRGAEPVRAASRPQLVGPPPVILQMLRGCPSQETERTGQVGRGREHPLHRRSLAEGSSVALPLVQASSPKPAGAEPWGVLGRPGPAPVLPPPSTTRVLPASPRPSLPTCPPLQN